MSCRRSLSCRRFRCRTRADCLEVRVDAPTGTKCERCWKYTLDVGSRPGLPDRVRGLCRGSETDLGSALMLSRFIPFLLAIGAFILDRSRSGSSAAVFPCGTTSSSSPVSSPSCTPRIAGAAFRLSVGIHEPASHYVFLIGISGAVMLLIGYVLWNPGVRGWARDVVSLQGWRVSRRRSRKSVRPHVRGHGDRLPGVLFRVLSVPGIQRRRTPPSRSGRDFFSLRCGFAASEHDQNRGRLPAARAVRCSEADLDRRFLFPNLRSADGIAFLWRFGSLSGWEGTGLTATA